MLVFAAGNDNGAVNFPGTIDEVFTVGASNQWDERKSPASKDGENWWGSNFGKSLDLVAPGVRHRHNRHPGDGRLFAAAISRSRSTALPRPRHMWRPRRP